MPGENIWSWSTTALSNGNADSIINFLEGQTRASLNDSCRSVMAAWAKFRNLTNGSIITGGTANAQTVTSGMAFTGAPPTGMIIRVTIGPGLTNNGPVTLNLDGIGAVAVQGLTGVALATGELVAGMLAEFYFNGTNWIYTNALTRIDALTSKNPVTADEVPIWDVAGGGLKKAVFGSMNQVFLLNTLTAALSTQLDDTTSITSNYNIYMIQLEQVLPNIAANLGLECRYQVAGTFPNANYISNTWSNNADGIYLSGDGTVVGQASNAAGLGISGCLYLYNPLGTTNAKYLAGMTMQDSLAAISGGFYNGSFGAVTGLRFRFVGGSIKSGQIKIYGINS